MESINIRTIQHYLYCAHRWGLLEINQQWRENSLVVKANLIHTLVDNKKHSYVTKDKTVLSSVAVFNDDLDIYGIVDCLEFLKSKNGAYIPSLKDNFNLSIVEYKPTKPKDGPFIESEKFQLFAQKLCVDSMFGCNCKTFIYYADTRKRIEVDFLEDSALNLATLQETLSQIRANLKAGTIPSKQRTQKCSGCSLVDICLPKTPKYNFKQEILSKLEEL